MPYRLPVNSRRFHGDMRAVFGRQPFRQCHEILGRRLERADLSLSRAIHHMAHAGHHCILVNIKTGTMPMQNFHRFSLNAAGLEPPLSKSRTRAPGLSPARDTIWGAQGFRVRLTDGLARTKINTDLCVDGTTAAYPRLPPVSYPAGRGLRWGANMEAIGDVFAVGYDTDYAEKYRHLLYIGAADEIRQSEVAHQSATPPDVSSPATYANRSYLIVRPLSPY